MTRTNFAARMRCRAFLRKSYCIFTLRSFNSAIVVASIATFWDGDWGLLVKEGVKTLITVAVGLGIAFLFLGTSPSFQACLSEHQSHADHGSAQEHTGRLLALYEIGRGCTGEWLHKHGEVLVTLFTIILGTATLLLWRATKDLVKGSERTAEMQLRAYIHTIGKDFLIQGIEHARFVHRFSIVNVGQTPAYKLHVESVTKPLPHPLPPNFDFTSTPKGRNPSVMMIGPRRRVGHDSFADAILSPGEMIRIKSPDSGLRLYSYGTINYETFGRSRYTNFCYFLEWEITPQGEAFNVHPSEQHNDAN